MGIDYKKLTKICKEYEQKNGKGSIFTKGSKNSILDIPRVSTCIEDLDEIIGGGLPEGRIIEISGPESSGKTSLALWLASLFEKSLYIPIEGTYDDGVATRMGVEKGQMIVQRAEYGEQAADMMLDFATAGVPLIILDSVPAMVPKDDVDRVEKTMLEEQRIGGVARLFNKMLPVLVRKCEKSGTIVVLINQVRDKMNAMLFGEKTDTPGGRAIKFYSSIRMQLARRQWIEIPNKNPKISATNEKIGMLMKARVIKSKVCNPYGECLVPLFFERGFESFANLEDIKNEYKAERGIRIVKKRN